MSDTKVLVVDTNIGLEHALGFGRAGYETYYAVVHAQPYPRMCDEICGYGFTEIKKIWDWGEGLEQGARVVVFTDSGFGYLAEWLRDRGYYVIGADGTSEKLELDRYYVRKVFTRLGIDIPPARVVKGVDNVKRVIAESGGRNVVVKISRVRGDVETFKTNDPYEAEVLLSRGGFKIFGDDVIFILEEEIKACEAGIDTWFNGKEFIGIVAETIELKGTGNITKFVPIEDSLWYGVLQKLEPWLRKNGYVGMFCMEGFWDGSKLRVIDVTPRFPYICFTEDAEILTKDGWKKFKELTENDLVATRDMVSGDVQYVKPKKIFKVWYDGDVIKYDSRTLKFAVTPDHMMVVIKRDTRNGKYSEPRFVRAAELERGEWYMIREFGNWEGKKVDRFVLPEVVYRKDYEPYMKGSKEIDMELWLKFLGWFIAEGSIHYDGSRYRIYITQRKEQNKGEIEEILTKLGMNWNYDGNSYYFYNKQIFVWLVENCYMCNEYRAWNKKVPEFVKELSSDLIEVFLDAFFKGDGGYRIKGGNIVGRNFYTSSKRLADDLQELILKTGRVATIVVERKKCGNDKYVVVDWKNNSMAKIRGDKVHREKYVGWVYDVEVEPYHTIYVRVDGKPFWSGNCSYAYPKVIRNYAEFMVGVAMGMDVVPDVAHKYSCQIGVYTDDSETWRVIKYGREDRDMIAYRKVIKKNDKIWFVPGDVVVAVGISDSADWMKAIDIATERAEGVSASNIYTCGREFKDYIMKVVERAGELGYEW